MAKYKVLPIALSIKNNKIASAGDIVDDSQLNSSAYDLIKDGFLELYEGDEPEVLDETVETEEEVDLEAEVEATEEEINEIEVKEEAVSKKDQIKNSLKKK